MTNEQIERLLQITREIEIDHCTYDELTITACKLAETPDTAALIEAKFEEQGLIYEETITVGDLRNGTIVDDALHLPDGRVLRFMKTLVIEWEEFDTCAS